MKAEIAWVPGVQLDPEGPVIELPAGWSVGAPEGQRSAFWAWHQDHPAVQLGCLAGDGSELEDVDAWAGRIAAELCDGRAISIDDRTGSGVTVVWHWMNFGVSTLHVQSAAAGEPSRPTIYCGSVPTLESPGFVALFNAYLTRAVRAFALPQPPLIAEVAG